MKRFFQTTLTVAALLGTMMAADRAMAKGKGATSQAQTIKASQVVHTPVHQNTGHGQVQTPPSKDKTLPTLPVSPTINPFAGGIN